MVNRPANSWSKVVYCESGVSPLRAQDLRPPVDSLILTLLHASKSFDRIDKHDEHASIARSFLLRGERGHNAGNEFKLGLFPLLATQTLL